MRGPLSYLLFPLFFLGILLPNEGNATHNRAGEITYEHVGGLTFRFTITTCTKNNQAAKSRNTLEVQWGDGEIDSLPRTNIQQIGGNYDARINTYKGNHTFPGAGEYTVSVEDPNRNSGVINIPSSVNKSFCIRTQLNIQPFTPGHNNSVQFTKRACNELACVGKTYQHNVGAYDPDGDSLAYEIVRCRGNGCQPISGYGFPDECSNCQPGPNNDMRIDQTTGDLIWDAPQKQGEYNVAVKVKEYDDGALRGWVVRDMQIRVLSCNDDPPKLADIEDTCVVAGAKIEKEVTAKDPNDGETVSLEASGEPFLVDNSPAIFPQGANDPDSVSAPFEWQTACSHVRPGEYQVLFEARDEQDPVALVDFESFFIEVVGPPPQNPSATPSGNQIELEWDEHRCPNVTGYNVYRRLGLYGYNPDSCETGVPGYTGYQRIGSTSSRDDTTFIDDDDLVHGQKYCYIITATFDNGAESIASIEFCTELIKDVPIITNASVGSTDVSNGLDTVRWVKPTELDTTNQHPGPYHYEIYRGEGFGSAPDFIGSTDTTNMLYQADTSFIDSSLNTVENPHSYRVELYSDGNSVGGTNLASTIYLETIVNDDRVRVEWDEEVPWTNREYELYRKGPSNSSFIPIDTTIEQEFLDSNVVNSEEYCYMVKGIGNYSSSDLPDSLINYSQKACASPEDRNPPCPPGPEADPTCTQKQVEFSWENADPSCGCPDAFWPEEDPECNDDVVEYRLFRKPTRDGEYEEVASAGILEETSFRYRNEGSIAGCYAVTAIDSAGNESGKSDSVCVDNCPVYELPNVFTPNGDGINELMKPVRSRYVKKVEMTVRNRWGQVVFETEDPELNWDGTNQNNGEPVSEGVYYYICRVHTLRLEGIKKIELTGQVQVLRGDPKKRP